MLLDAVSHLAHYTIHKSNINVWTEFIPQFLLFIVHSSPVHNTLPFLSDPSIRRYRVQWVPEYCSHNQTRGMEKVITQVIFSIVQTIQQLNMVHHTLASPLSSRVFSSYGPDRNKLQYPFIME